MAEPGHAARKGGAGRSACCGHAGKPHPVLPMLRALQGDPAQGASRADWTHERFPPSREALGGSTRALRSDRRAALTDYDRMFPLGDPPDSSEQESSLGCPRRREGRDPREACTTPDRR